MIQPFPGYFYLVLLGWKIINQALIGFYSLSCSHLFIAHPDMQQGLCPDGLIGSSVVRNLAVKADGILQGAFTFFLHQAFLVDLLWALGPGKTATCPCKNGNENKIDPQ